MDDKCSATLKSIIFNYGSYYLLDPFQKGKRILLLFHLDKGDGGWVF